MTSAQPSPAPGLESASTTTDRRVEMGRIGLFFGVLAALVVGLRAATWIAGPSIVEIGPLYMFTPMIAALVVCRRGGIPLSDVGFRVGRKRWLAIAAVAWLPIAGVIFALSLGVPGVAFDSSIDIAAAVGLPSGTFWSLAAVGVLVAIGASINAVPGFGEEFGWRGYLLWELAPLGFWKASLVIGTAWGLWHAPLIVAGLNYPSFPYVGIVAFTIVCVAISPLLTYLVVRAESVLPAAVFHGVFNAAGLVLVTADDVVIRELVVGEGGAVGVAVFGLVAVAIALVGTPRLTREFAGTERPVRNAGRPSSSSRGGSAVAGDQ